MVRRWIVVRIGKEAQVVLEKTAEEHVAQTAPGNPNELRGNYEMLCFTKGRGEEGKHVQLCTKH